MDMFRKYWIRIHEDPSFAKYNIEKLCVVEAVRQLEDNKFTTFGRMV